MGRGIWELWGEGFWDCRLVVYRDRGSRGDGTI